MNIEWVTYIILLLLGMLLGLFFYGGLWITVKIIPNLRQPYLWITISILGRMIVTLFCFYLLFDHHWQQLIIVFMGFILLRSIILHRVVPRITGLRQLPPETIK